MLSPRRAIKLRKSRISKKRHFSTCRPPSRTVFGPFSIVFGSFSGRFRTVSGRFAQFSHRFFPFFRIVAPRRGRRGVTAPPLRRRSAAARDFQRRSAASEVDLNYSGVKRILIISGAPELIRSLEYCPCGGRSFGRGHYCLQIVIGRH